MSWGFGAARLLVLAVGLTMAVAGLAILASPARPARSPGFA